ncbi:hypothetical protein HY772_08545 [Candidatus Woesearchaeota archaeon]|nr:hypothetical protein [Candidatus Woesearchaeota archaeon]
MSTEFIIFFGFMFLIFVIFLIGVADRYKTLAADKERILLSDQAQKIRKEILVASTVEDGYSRSFEIPASLDGVSFTIQVVNDVLVLESSKEESSLKMPPINGTLQKGATNTIEKKNGLLCINGGC